MSLPVEPFLPEICRRLRDEKRLLLCAAPGAGKTTCVPGALAEEFPGERIIMVEPRRVAASAAAMRISALAGTSPGQFAGFAVRGERKYSASTRVLVVTPGVLLRMLQNDPALEEAGVIIFDEFHERSLECDLLFALIMESCKVFREDLKVLVMSATLDTGAVREILNCPECLNIPGREFPVEQLWSPELCPREKIVPAMARAIMQMLPESEGNLLAFFPGVGEIKRCRELLEGQLGDEILLEELHGSLSLDEQSRVLTAAPPGKRKVVLSTNVAESSLTVDNVRCVIDCGYERNPRYDAGSGLTFLETEAISQASAVQRTGRAGRVAPGKALRLWDSHSHPGRRAFKVPEIYESDLSAFALEIALWGARKEELSWLDAPPEGAFAEGVKLLQLLGALDEKSQPTPLGREMAKYPVHPRIAAILVEGMKRRKGALAIEIAALLENKSDPSFPREADLTLHIDYLRRHLKQHRSHKVLMDQLFSLTGIPREEFPATECGELLLAGFPDRLAKERRRNQGSYTLFNGRGARLAEGDTLWGNEFLVAAETGGKSTGDSILFKAAAVDGEYVLEKFCGQLVERRKCSFDTESGKVICRKETFLGAIVINSTPVPLEPGEAAQGIFDAALKRGIALIPDADKNGRFLRERIAFAHRNDPEEFPDLSDSRLAELGWRNHW